MPTEEIMIATRALAQKIMSGETLNARQTQQLESYCLLITLETHNKLKELEDRIAELSTQICTDERVKQLAHEAAKETLNHLQDAGASAMEPHGAMPPHRRGDWILKVVFWILKRKLM